MGSIDKAYPGQRAEELFNLDKEYPEWGVTLLLRKSQYGGTADSTRKVAE